MSGCQNCGGRNCMACAFGQEHDKCENDCPECCNQPLWDQDDRTIGYADDSDYREGEEIGY